MTGKTPKRRDVLKAAGTVGSVGVVGLASGSQVEYGSVRFIEAGLWYDLPDEHPYYELGIDSLKPYRLDKNNEKLALLPEAPDVVHRLVAEHDTIIAGTVMRAGPAVIGGTGRTELLTTEFASGYRPAGAVRLTESLQQPSAFIKVNDGNVTVSVDGVTDRLPTNREYSRKLDVRKVTAKTAQVVNEPVDNPAVPEAQRSLKTEYGEVTVPTVPTVNAINHGELNILELSG